MRYDPFGWIPQLESRWSAITGGQQQQGAGAGPNLPPGVRMTSTGNPQLYTPQQFTNEIFGIQDVSAEGDVLLKKGNVYSARDVDEGGGRFTNTPPAVKSYRDALGALHQMNPGQLQSFKDAMYDAGFYKGTGLYEKGVRATGELVDAATLNAAQYLFTTTMQYGGKKSVEEILAQGKKDLMDPNNRAGAGFKDAQPKQGTVTTIDLSDPATLRVAIDKLGTAILGRQVGDKERDALVNEIIAAEKNPQLQQAAAIEKAEKGTSSTLTQFRVDANARLQEKIAAQNPAEAEATSYNNNYSVLKEMLGGL